MQLGPIIPAFRIFDEAKAREFYLDFLGFKVDWEHRFEPGLPLYCGISRGGCILHLTEHHGDGCPGASIRISCSDVRALAEELNAKKYKHARPGVEETPWGSIDLQVTDPFGNRITFTETVSEST